MPTKKKLVRRAAKLRARLDDVRAELAAEQSATDRIAEEKNRASRGWGAAQRRVKELERQLEETRRTPTAWVEIYDRDGNRVRAGVASGMESQADEADYSITSVLALVRSDVIHRVQFVGHREPYTFRTSDGYRAEVRAAVLE